MTPGQTDHSQRMDMQFWLVTTDHLTDRLWFKDEEDFKAGMNITAILAATTRVEVLAFILMSNHVHFVLEGTFEDARDYITRFKKMYSQRFCRKYSSKELLRNNHIDLRALRLGDESLEKAIAYTQMNCVAANISLTPSDYVWGTGSTFFRSQPRMGTRVRDMSARSLISFIHSKRALPSDYLINHQGFVDPASYVAVRFVESVFRTPKRMQYFLSNSSKARRIHEAPSFTDQLVGSGMKDLCVSLFRKKNLEELSDSQKTEILRQVRYRFSADPAQIARISGLSYDEVCRLLEAF